MCWETLRDTLLALDLERIRVLELDPQQYILPPT